MKNSTIFLYITIFILLILNFLIFFIPIFYSKEEGVGYFGPIHEIEISLSYLVTNHKYFIGGTLKHRDFSESCKVSSRRYPYDYDYETFYDIKQFCSRCDDLDNKEYEMCKDKDKDLILYGVFFGLFILAELINIIVLCFTINTGFNMDSINELDVKIDLPSKTILSLNLTVFIIFLICNFLIPVNFMFGFFCPLISLLLSVLLMIISNYDYRINTF